MAIFNITVLTSEQSICPLTRLLVRSLARAVDRSFVRKFCWFVRHFTLRFIFADVMQRCAV